MTVLDRAALVRRLMGDEELAAAIIADFVEDLPGQMEALSRGVESCDAPSVQHLAHSVKGAAATVGALALAEASGRLEAAGRAGDLNEAGSLLRDVDDRCCELRDMVSATSCSAEGATP